MKHLFNTSIYEDKAKLNDALNEVGGLRALGADGVELLTAYDDIIPSDYSDVISVHLPYCVDWYTPWNGVLVNNGKDPEYIRYQHYGVDPKSIISTLERAIDVASVLKPKYGVFHANSVCLNEVLSAEYSTSDEEIVSTLVDLMNSLMQNMPKGEPPFTIAFENTWWPGLRLTDQKSFEILKNGLEFDNWGICFDTGHLLVSAGGTNTEEDSLALLNSYVDTFSDDLIDRTLTMHLHVNTCKDVKSKGPPVVPKETSEEKILEIAYKYIVDCDQHLPFTNEKVVDFVERLSLDYVVHEMACPTLKQHAINHKQQNSLFL